MAHKMLRPYTFLLYFLSIIAGFFLGLMYAGIVEAGKGQMLAAGAIVLGYGVLGSVIGLVFALAVAFWAQRQFIVGINLIMVLLVVGFMAYYMGKHQRKRTTERIEVPSKSKLPSKKPTSPALGPSFDSISMETGNTEVVEDIGKKNTKNIAVTAAREIGLGLYAPDILSGQSLYFYRWPLTEWPPLTADIVDSIAFHMNQYGNPVIATAPPWFVPEHQKVDYGILFMKIITEYRNTLEVEVNKTTGQTAIILREPGRVVYWPEFILSVYSIDLQNKTDQMIRVKPLDHAGEVTQNFSILRPVAIRANWVQVHLLDEDLNKRGEGWVKWRDNGRLLVNYSLLS